MDEKQLAELLAAVREGRMPPEKALERLKRLPFEDMGYAKVDHHRQLRTGVPEVIYCAGKTPEQARAIAQRMVERGSTNILATRCSAEIFAALRDLPETRIYEQARIARINYREYEELPESFVLVSCAGTSDLPVAEEAALTAEAVGCRVERIYDVGVAGIHRLLAHADQFQRATAIVCVAGMEGALPSVVAGLTDKPVIAVPTSVGYGANFGGLSALLTMLNSCSAGISVVNIDNGFGAGFLAARIVKLVEGKG